MHGLHHFLFHKRVVLSAQLAHKECPYASKPCPAQELSFVCILSSLFLNFRGEQDGEDGQEDECKEEHNQCDSKNHWAHSDQPLPPSFCPCTCSPFVFAAFHLDLQRRVGGLVHTVRRPLLRGGRRLQFQESMPPCILQSSNSKTRHLLHVASFVPRGERCDRNGGRCTSPLLTWIDEAPSRLPRVQDTTVSEADPAL